MFVVTNPACKLQYHVTARLMVLEIKDKLDTGR